MRATARIRAGLMVAIVALGLPACRPRETRQELSVGSQRISIVTPEGWQVVDLGRQVVVRRGTLQLALEDLGPVGPRGIRREAERARELWRQGRAKDALWCLRRVPVPAALFTSVAQQQAFWTSWSEVTGAPADAALATIEAAFDRLLANVATLEERPIEGLAEDAVAAGGRDRRRDVSGRGRRIVDGRPTVVLDTWNRLTHRARQRIVLVFDDGYVLALRTEEGPFPAAAVSLEGLVVSLRFKDREGQVTGVRGLAPR